MADTKISALTAIDVVAGGDEFAANDITGPQSRKVTADQLGTYIAPAASDTVAGKIEIAIQSEQETGTDATRAVTPGRQHFHPSAAKFWVKWTGNSTTILVSYNMTSIADTGVGDADGTIATDFSSVDWSGQVDVLITAGSAWDATFTTGCGYNAQAADTFGVLCSKMQDGGTAAASLVDPAAWMASGFGDHA